MPRFKARKWVCDDCGELVRGKRSCPECGKRSPFRDTKRY